MFGRFAVSSFLVSLPLAFSAPALAQEKGDGADGAVEVMRFGRITVAESRLYCWPSAVLSPPQFEDTVAKDDVVRVGRTEGSFVQVMLPLGPTGYVSKRFAAADDSGTVRTTGNKVAFRYRTRTTEAPVTQLPRDSELHVIGEEGDWWQVRHPDVECWLPATEVLVLDPNDPAAAQAYAESKRAYETAIKARLDSIKKAKEQAAQDEADAAAVALVQDAFRKELQKPVAEQKFDGLNSTLDKLEGTLAEDSSAKGLIASLRKRIQTQKWIVDATVVTSETPKPAELPVRTEQPKDQLERFQSIGWLRYEGKLGGLGIFYLEKGGMRLHHVACTTGRYDLALFVDCEVGMQGPRRRPATESFSIMDVERLEVLGHNRK
ncbi:MAG: hypothetical protein NXI31_23150 [bacterium]|nr:hypothetical protein [bacterium]